MRLLNRWVRTLIASFFCFVVLPHFAFAVDETLGSPKAKTEALGIQDTQWKADLADVNARITELEAVIAKAEAQMVATRRAEVSAMHVRVDAINSEIAKLVVEIATTEEALARSETVLRPVEMDVTTIESLIKARARLEMDIAKANAQIVSVKKEPKAQKVTVGRCTTPEPSIGHVALEDKEVALVKQIVLDRHTPSLCRSWQRQDTIYQRANPWGDDYCRSVQVRGGAGHACDATIWRHLSRGTVISVPAGAVLVKVPAGTKVPEAIALSPTEDNDLFALDVNAPIVTENEVIANITVVALNREVARLDAQLVMIQRGLLAALILLGIFMVLFFATLFGYGAQKRLIHERDIEITKLKNAVDEILGIAAKSFEAECHPEKVAREHGGTLDTCVPTEGNSAK